MIFYPAWKTPWENLSFVSTWLASSSLFFAYFLADISFLLLSSPWFFPSFLFCFSRWLSMFFSSLADEDKARSLSFDSLVPRLPHLHHHHYNPHYHHYHLHFFSPSPLLLKYKFVSFLSSNNASLFYNLTTLIILIHDHLHLLRCHLSFPPPPTSTLVPSQS